jgi:hypothetical protein
MNPWSLLTKGHTINGFKNHKSVYRLTNRGIVPDFTAGKNASPTPSHPQPEISQSTFFDLPQPCATAPAPQPPALAPQPLMRQTIWSRLAGFHRGLLQKWAARRKASPFHGRTVQTELVLEKVKVVRNDLLEDDTEVVPVGKKQNPAQHEQCQAISTNR